MKRRQGTMRFGISMLEVVISTMIVGGLIVVSLDTVGAAYRHHRIVADQQDGYHLAHELMSEILSMPYADPEEGAGTTGRETGESNTTRTDFDDIDDYHGWDASDPTDREGNLLTGYDGWQRQVSVTWANRTDGSARSDQETGLRRIVVTVTNTNVTPNVATEVVAIRSKNGLLEQPAMIDMNAITHIGGELQLGNSPKTIRRGTPLTNHVDDPE